MSQVDRYLVPLPSADQMQAPIEGMISSFFDSPDDFSGELRENFFRIGANIWWRSGKGWYGELGAGTFQINRNQGGVIRQDIGVTLGYKVVHLSYNFRNTSTYDPRSETWNLRARDHMLTLSFLLRPNLK